jgi:hypothetical protein
MRTHHSLREDVKHWKATMQALLESNVHANRWFLGTLAGRHHSLKQYLLKCPSQVRCRRGSVCVSYLPFACRTGCLKHCSQLDLFED